VVVSDAPIDKIPLFVRSGSIIPLGPFVQYTTEKIADPIELRVYTGADGNFTLYEDENDNYNYEKGIFATIGFKWDNVKRCLTIGTRQGSFPGMLTRRTFQVTLVDKNKGNDIIINAKPDKVIVYDGTKQDISF